MHRETYHVIGTMSGTSLDGIDIVDATFVKENNQWTFVIHHAETIAYHEHWLQLLKTISQKSEEEVTKLNVAYTQYIAEVYHNFIEKYHIDIHKIDALCNHGHTVWHQPDKGFTLQIGNLPELSTYLKLQVVGDFRTQDVKLGGQGAPLVPIGDRLLFSEYDYCLNLGGFANISFEKNHQRIAFDICPVNTVLNYYAQQLGFPYDKDGQIARSGKVSTHLLKQLNQLSFYQEKPPKSLGVEWVHQYIFPLMETYPLSIKDKIATFTQHVVAQISQALEKNKDLKLLVTGGGAYNTHLMRQLQKITEVEVIIPQSEIVEYKEALVFGFLGVLRLRNEVNCLKSVTGASKNHSSGALFLY
ncbi:anhydro-N-acetylmuramic acid kinase [Mesonia sp. K7]|uniref:anhydro-N-acetylmuramic acid kinase n=1 Tax=Mesonia sp. K7 TaxID=2218606 RepID=UPI000DA9C2FE|nr:anhydro-N-acetylmuramic acid kinase [Mesonia sp. K7]PZD77148.1 anhydro-N-acetylmuramic acid kinase [Mesonia sp. K7]